MAGNTFGTVFRITTAGESHGPANVVIVDGCPAGLSLTEECFQADMDRRRPGQSRLSTQRKEADRVEILSGVFEGRSTGTPIALLIRNEDARSRDYSEIKDKYRPGHADYTYDAKYGFRDYRGGGRASARETVSRVAAGVIAKKILHEVSNILVQGYVIQIGTHRIDIDDPESVVSQAVEQMPDGEPNLVRCPNPDMAIKMAKAIEGARKNQDSLGGVAEICVSNVPAGLGEPVFDKLKADLGKALFSIPAVMGVEYGNGFASAAMFGSENNDPFVKVGDGIRTRGNHHGGMLGGISSGMPIVVRAAVKPTSSLPRAQDTVNDALDSVTIQTKGRHDPCVLPRFVPIAEAMVAVVMADHLLRHRASVLRLG